MVLNVLRLEGADVKRMLELSFYHFQRTRVRVACVCVGGGDWLLGFGSVWARPGQAPCAS